jgi:hypothetical protein
VLPRHHDHGGLSVPLLIDKQGMHLLAHN